MIICLAFAGSPSAWKCSKKPSGTHRALPDIRKSFESVQNAAKIPGNKHSTQGSLGECVKRAPNGDFPAEVQTCPLLPKIIPEVHADPESPTGATAFFWAHPHRSSSHPMYAMLTLGSTFPGQPQDLGLDVPQLWLAKKSIPFPLANSLTAFLSVSIFKNPPRGTLFMRRGSLLAVNFNYWVSFAYAKNTEGDQGGLATASDNNPECWWHVLKTKKLREHRWWVPLAVAAQLCYFLSLLFRG